MKLLPIRSARTSVLLLALGAAFVSSACAPLMLGGAMMGGAIVATDRRTSGTQVEDEGIEFKAAARIREQLGDKGHVNVNAYNRMVLLTGEVASEAERARIEKIASEVENVRHVLNETAVLGNSSLSSRTSDVTLAGKIKFSLVDARDLISNAFYVVVERGTVYMMGRVSEREASRAVEIARGVSGTQKVVRAFEIISEEELARLTPKRVEPQSK
ncbi:BON domain-containing protein [Paucibacter sp. DJ2R-2]|uniref:BON domain-containing protein n=1 Tax=Paucibacter sp. DJ2R-2 TaxID=2893558 RepID=UPI0021E3C3F9|nr:BON domain-containing protein [Paucibacter sp. DJ2R-2]MCV2421953.1 BON domain-containing protein [Paucibacter sp. DJ4R-1]MCV2439430.1 BON domain-containing protein [Paucibacter sp. DJ2R-2]